jgi:two-component system nitrogen regulation response regulator NtrX
MERILIIDDSESLCKQLQISLELEDYEVGYRASFNGGLKAALEEKWDVILLDVMLDAGKSGLDILQKVKDRNPEQLVVMFSGQSNIDIAVKATRLGAFDFIEKPADDERLLLTLRNALEQKSLKETTGLLLAELQDKLHIVGNSTRITNVINHLVRLSGSDSKVLIYGETGVGKDLFAKGIHFRSKRADKPYVSINCAAIPTTLAESELFGYVKGAFTGANSSRPGRFEMADGGTILLDEIADLNYDAQAKVLRILQNGEFERLGDNKTIKVDVRILAATNKNLREEVDRGRFREDLYYRLNVISVTIPALRERKEDIPQLAEYFLHQFCLREGKKISHFSGEALELLNKYDYPGNVRQLRSIVERIVIFEQNSFVDYGSASMAMQMEEDASQLAGESGLLQAVADFEREFISVQLTQNNWNLEMTARRLAITETELKDKIGQYQLEP